MLCSGYGYCQAKSPVYKWQKACLCVHVYFLLKKKNSKKDDNNNKNGLLL